jgi:phage-related protein
MSITYNGIEIFEYNAYDSGTESYAGPERDTEQIHVPGRSGDLIFDNGCYKNQTIPYNCFIPANFPYNFEELRNFLLSDPGYHRLEDTRHPREYRMAEVKGPINPNTGVDNQSGTFDIVFNMKPQRWLLEGELPITFTSSGASIVNPTRHESKPLIRAYGNGTLTIGSKTVTIAGVSESYIDIDCETEDAFYNTAANNRNSKVTCSGDFPRLAPGSTGITFSGITKVIITPRWFVV